MAHPLCAQARRSFRRRRPRRLGIERLEDRIDPTTTVFLDFGFNFPAGGLTVNDVDMLAVGGPLVFGLGQTLIPLTTTIQNENIDLNGDSVADLADAQILADRVTALVQREYAPFDVIVQQASANTVADIAATLALNGNGAGNRDAYIIAAGDDPPPPNNALGWAPVDAGNTQDNTGFAFADQMIRSLGIDMADTGLGRTTAHEAAHTFGLEHTRGTDDRPATQGDMMNAPVDLDMDGTNDAEEDNRQFGAIHLFTRFDLPSQSGGGDLNGYNTLAAAGTVGLRPGAAAYVTGTGAFDRITVTRNAAVVGQANVLVEAFSAFDGTTFSGLIATNPYNVSTAAGLLIDAGFSTDQILVDGTLGVTVTIRGMNGVDQLVVQGNGAATAAYTPAAAEITGLDGDPYRAAQVSVTSAFGTTAISVEEFQDAGSVTVQNVGAVTFNGSAGVDDLTLSVASGVVRTTGSVSGTSFIPLAMTGASSYAVVGGADGDTVRLAANLSGLLTGLTVDGGAGSDGLLYQDGAGHVVTLAGHAPDGFSGQATTVPGTFTNIDRVQVSVGGSELRGLNVDADWTVQAGDDTYRDPAAARQLAFAGFDHVSGGSARDHFRFTPGGSLAGFVDGGFGTDTVDLSALADQQLGITGLGLADGFNLTGGGTAAFGGLFNIDIVLGSAGGTTDRLTGRDANAIWSVKADAAQTFYEDVVTGRWILFAQFEELFGGALADRVTVDVSGGSPIPAAGLLVDGQGGNDFLGAVGRSVADEFDLSAADLRVNGDQIRYVHVETLEAKGGAGNDRFRAPVNTLPAEVGLVRFLGDGGNDSATVAPTFLAVLRLEGGAGFDTLRVNREGAVYQAPIPPRSVTSGTYQFTNRRLINFLSFESRLIGIIQMLP